MLGDWRERVPAWWAGYANGPYVRAREQIAAFQAAFPWQDLPRLSIDQVGRVSGRRDTLTHALIWGTKGVVDLGRVNDLGLWQEGGEWRTSASESPEAVYERLRDGLYDLASLANEERWAEIDERGKALFGSAGSLRIKPLYLWFPEALAPSVKWDHMGRTLELLGRDAPDESMIVRNRRLWQALREEPAFAFCESDALPATHFFYWDPETKPYLMNGASPTPGASSLVAAPEATAESGDLLALLRREKNVVLTGPPGTGKTWLAQSVARVTSGRPMRGAKEEVSSIKPERWYDILALALYEIDRPATVDDLLVHPSVEEALIRTGKKPARTTVWGQLQEHASLESLTVRVASRRDPALFDKGTDSKWRLIPTGKEYVEQFLLPRPSANSNAESLVEFVTFHPSFGYEEFVEGIRPAMDEEGEGALRYEVRRGPFLRMADAARAAWERDGAAAPDFLVVVDEINRADVARTFGDLLALLEPSKRLGGPDALEATLPYSGRRLGLPPNLLLLATMNASDRSVAAMDLALRRRFAFAECAPDPDLLGMVAGVDLGRLLRTLNEGIGALLGADLALGHAFLMGVADGPSMEAAWRGQVLPQLAETFHGRTGELEALLGSAFFEEVSLPARLAGRFDAPPRRMRDLRGDALLAALSGLCEEPRGAA